MEKPQRSRVICFYLEQVSKIICTLHPRNFNGDLNVFKGPETTCGCGNHNGVCFLSNPAFHIFIYDPPWLLSLIENRPMGLD